MVDIKYKGKLSCGFCRNIQKVNIKTTSGGKRSRVTDQAICSKCGNYISHDNKTN